jgi:hypothetical protein
MRKSISSRCRGDARIFVEEVVCHHEAIVIAAQHQVVRSGVRAETDNRQLLGVTDGVFFVCHMIWFGIAISPYRRALEIVLLVGGCYRICCRHENYLRFPIRIAP